LPAIDSRVGIGLKKKVDVEERVFCCVVLQAEARWPSPLVFPGTSGFDPRVA